MVGIKPQGHRRPLHACGETTRIHTCRTRKSCGAGRPGPPPPSRAPYGAVPGPPPSRRPGPAGRSPRLLRPAPAARTASHTGSVARLALFKMAERPRGGGGGRGAPAGGGRRGEEERTPRRPIRGRPVTDASGARGAEGGGGCRAGRMEPAAAEGMRRGEGGTRPGGGGRPAGAARLEDDAGEWEAGQAAHEGGEGGGGICRSKRWKTEKSPPRTQLALFIDASPRSPLHRAHPWNTRA